eukprot:s1645_g2.t1
MLSAFESQTKPFYPNENVSAKHSHLKKTVSKVQRWSLQADPAYCKWFLKKWGSSPKKEHKMFSHYLMLWVERQELEQGTCPDPPSHGPTAASAACPKAKTKPSPIAGQSSATAIDLEIEEEEEWWDHVTPPAAQKESENSRRLDQIEGVLSLH